MTNKKFYVTVEVSVQLSGSKEENTEENRRLYRREIIDRLINGKRKLNYNCYIHSENVICIYDEKGMEL